MMGAGYVMITENEHNYTSSREIVLRQNFPIPWLIT